MAENVAPDAVLTPSGGRRRIGSSIPAGRDTQSAMLPNGDFVLAWTAGDPSDVFARVVSSTGALKGDAFLVNTATFNSQHSPKIGVLANGNFVIGWTDPSGGAGGAQGDSDGGVKAQLFAPNGARIGSEFLVNTATAGHQGISHIEALAGGGFMIAWEDAGPGTGGADGDPYRGLKLQFFDAAGRRQGTEILLNGAVNWIQEDVTVTELTDGRIAFAWVDDSQGVGGAPGDANSTAIKGEVFTATGVRVHGEFLVNTTTAGPQSNPSIIALSAGRFAVTWESTAFEGPAPIRTRLFDANGNPLTGEIEVSQPLRHTPMSDAAALAGGGFVVVWENLPGSEWRDWRSFQAQMFDSLGSKVGAVIDFGQSREYSFALEVAGLADGGFVVASQRDQEQAYAQVFSAAGAPDAQLRLAGYPNYRQHFSLLATADGGFLAGWTGGAQLYGPPAFSTRRDVSVSLAGQLSVADPDAGSGVETAALTVTTGLLEIDAGLTGAMIAGNGTAYVSVTGTIAQINGVLSGSGGSFAHYLPPAGRGDTAATLRLTINDNANSGTGGAKMDSESAPILIDAKSYFAAPSQWMAMVPSSGQSWYVGDFNGDGRDDAFRVGGASGADMFQSTGRAFSGAGSWTATQPGADGWFVGDFDGNGRDDVFRYLPGASGADMQLSNGSAFFADGSWTPAGYGSDDRWYVGDFDGDGKDDVFRYLVGTSGADMFLSNGSAFDAAGSWTPAGFGSDGTWHVGDFNGDGKDDVFRYLEGQQGVQVFLSTGASFEDAGSWSAASLSPGSSWSIGDFDGDGKDDILRFGASDASSQVFLSTGSAFGTGTTWSGESSGLVGWTVGDFTGDGTADLLRVTASGTHVVI
ncbi:VCBS repeat-containing protein [Sphingosinicella sp. LY1275]|uniref:FG-GAP repeat domain-containing protein n=1 Tax=Sphingosinicella sp. LY1275 TaxID=3095379 RepID=UPI002ADEE740|nr:VCBS repeat-containing protein [Sphingosinicella sp. LY1275]MEA1014666.1 VCBS repeat-containing protein [Sphingosinicella sp. LY1275]